MKPAILMHQYKKYQTLKETGRSENLLKKGKCVLLTQDIQALKECPSLNASTLYFKGTL